MTTETQAPSSTAETQNLPSFSDSLTPKQRKVVQDELYGRHRALQKRQDDIFAAHNATVDPIWEAATQALIDNNQPVIENVLQRVARLEAQRDNRLAEIIGGFQVIEALQVRFGFRRG